MNDINYDIIHLMGQVLIRNLEDQTIAALKARAAARGHSLEQELREVLTAAASPTASEVRSIAASIRALEAKSVATDLEALIREDRDR